MSSKRRHEAGAQDSVQRERLSVDACRRLLPSDCLLSDETVLMIRDQLYGLAESIVSLAPARTAQEEIAERAAIMEYDGGLSRVEADRQAVGHGLRGVH